MSELQQWSVKYRPKSLKSFIGSPDTVKLVEQFLHRRTGHALLLTGPSGCGKTTLAKIIARKYAVQDINVRETNASSDSGIDEIRSMIEAARYVPLNQNACKVFVLEEAHGLTKKAAAALLRPIEEPPHNHLIWILVTDRPWMLDTAILNRLRKFPVNLPTDRELASYLWKIVQKENIFQDMQDSEAKKSCLLIARTAECVPREAVQILQNAHEGKVANFKDLRQYVIHTAKVGDVHMDKIAAEILIAILGDGKVEASAERLVNAYMDADAMGVLTRCVFQLHNLLIFILAGQRNKYYAIRPLVDGLQKGRRPKIDDITDVARIFGKLRNDLREVVLDPSTVILPTMLDCLFKIKGDNHG